MELTDNDAAKRIHDTVALHLIAASDRMDPVGQWAAFRLDNGRSDNDLYPTKTDAIRHQKGNPKEYVYMRITPDGISVNDAARWLRANRNPHIDTTA